MDDRTLGKTGLPVSVLGLGAAGIGNMYETLTDEQGAAVVRQALDLGITYIDTAPLYGKGTSERRIGLALRASPGARGRRGHQDRLLSRGLRFQLPRDRAERRG